MLVATTLGLVLGALQGCAPARSPKASTPTAPSTTTPTGDTHSTGTTVTTGNTGSTGTTASDTGTGLPPLELPEPTPGVLPPTSRILPSHGVKLTSTFGAIALPDDAPLLSVGVEGEVVNRSAVYLNGIPDPGDHLLIDIWDGVSKGGPHYDTIAVPDVDGDGTYDYWTFYTLLPGPIMGTDIGVQAYYGDPIAYLSPSEVSPPLGFGEVVLSNFDADGDGHIDILVDNGAANFYEVYFGPFEGEIDENLTNAEKTNIGAGGADECKEPPMFLPDLFGPGEHGVAVGGQDWPRFCPRDRFVVPLAVERTGATTEVGS